MYMLFRRLFMQIMVCPGCMCYGKIITKRYVSRSITGDLVTSLNEDTLTGRLLIYLNPTSENKKSTNICNLKINDPKRLRIFNIEDVISCFTLLSSPKHFGNRDQIWNYLNILDSEFCRRLNYLGRKDKLTILHAYMNVIPNRIVQYEYYKVAVEEIFYELETLDKKDLVQLMFFIGLQKKSAQSQRMLKKCMKVLCKKFINDLTTEELCIVCNSTFKTSTKIKDELFLNKVTRHLSDNLCLLNDPALFITLIKTLRHNRFQTEDILATISCTVFFNKTIQYYSFSALCHILALYSDFLYYDEKLMKTFTDKCIKQLKESDYFTRRKHMREQARAKDIKRFLWCLSNLNYKYLQENDVKDVIIPNILKRLEAGEFKDNFISLTDIMLYLWMLNYRAYELVPYALSGENIQLIRASKVPSLHRLNLLLTCIYFEDRRLYMELKLPPHANTAYDIKLQLKKRPSLQRILENLKAIAVQGDVNKYEMSCQVPFLNIVGIVGYQKGIYRAVNIEVLDEYTTLKNLENTPTGLMHLKLRILDSCEEGLIVVRATEVDSMSEDQLCSFLQDELDLVC